MVCARAGRGVGVPPHCVTETMLGCASPRFGPGLEQLLSETPHTGREKRSCRRVNIGAGIPKLGSVLVAIRNPGFSGTLT